MFCEEMSKVRIDEVTVKAILQGCAKRNGGHGLTKFRGTDFDDRTLIYGPRYIFQTLISSQSETLEWIELVDVGELESSDLKDMFTSCKNLIKFTVNTSQGGQASIEFGDVISKEWVCRDIKVLRIILNRYIPLRQDENEAEDTEEDSDQGTDNDMGDEEEEQGQGEEEEEQSQSEEEEELSQRDEDASLKDEESSQEHTDEDMRSECSDDEDKFTDEDASEGASTDDGMHSTCIDNEDEYTDDEDRYTEHEYYHLRDVVGFWAHPRPPESAIVRQAAQKVYAQIGRMTKLRVLILGWDESSYAAPRGKAFKFDLTLKYGWLSELSELKELSQFGMTTNFWSHIDQPEVEFMDAVRSLERETYKEHWEWLKEKRPSLEFAYLTSDNKLV